MVKDHGQLHHFPGQIEATHYLDSPVYAVFNALEGKRQHPTSFVTVTDQPKGPDDFDDVLFLDSDGDDVLGKLEAYTKKMTQTFIEHESSPFMRPTLRFVQQLSEQRKVIMNFKAGPNSSRLKSCLPWQPPSTVTSRFSPWLLTFTLDSRIHCCNEFSNSGPSTTFWWIWR